MFFYGLTISIMLIGHPVSLFKIFFCFKLRSIKFEKSQTRQKIVITGLALMFDQCNFFNHCFGAAF